MTSPAVNVDQSAAVNANIKALEGLLDEFFRDVSNERKAEIERMLAEFGEQVTNFLYGEKLPFTGTTIFKKVKH